MWQRARHAIDNYTGRKLRFNSGVGGEMRQSSHGEPVNLELAHATCAQAPTELDNLSSLLVCRLKECHINHVRKAVYGLHIPVPTSQHVAPALLQSMVSRESSSSFTIYNVLPRWQAPLQLSAHQQPL
jgi:hypothetical protein